jgi:nucleotide-binding universal stress UspA family protein
MQNLRNIVVGLDFSGASEPALAQAEALSKHHNARLVLLHASGLTDASTVMHDEAVRTAAPWQSYVEDRMKKAREMLQEATARCRDGGIDALSRLSHGMPDAVIVATAHDVDADLVVVGTHNRSNTDRWLLGSVAERVVRLSQKNVLIAREGTPARGQLDRMLVATDFSPTADRGLQLALGLAAPSCTIEVVHCWEPPSHYGLPPPAPLVERLRNRAHERGNQLLAQFGTRTNGLHFELAFGPPAETILQRLEAGEHDIVVIGSHGRRGVRRLMLGSVAERVARGARVSVLVAHGTDA